MLAHTLNIIVQEASDNDIELSTVRQKARNIVTYFKQSVKAKDKLGEIQLQANKEEKKLIRDVVTRWNSSYYMYDRIVEIYHEINTVLCFMDKNDLCLSTTDISIMKNAIGLLQPFEQATREISADKFVLISKVIPLARMLQRITVQYTSSAAACSTLALKQQLIMSMNKRFPTNMESNYILAVGTLLDPRFKKLVFGDQTACSQAVDGLTTELAATINETLTNTSEAGPSSSNDISDSQLWSLIDERITATHSRPPTSSSIVSLRSYLDEPNLCRKEDPLK